MQAIINQAITTAWTNVEIDTTRTSGSFAFWSRGGTDFHVKMPGGSAYLTVSDGAKIGIDNIETIDGVLFQAKAISGTETIEVLIA